MLDFNEFLQQRRAALRPVKAGPSSSSAGQDDQQQQQQQERSATAPGAALLPSSSSRLGPSRQMSLLRDGGSLAGSLSSRGQLLPNSSSSLLLQADSLGSPRSPRTASAAAAVAAATAATIAALKSCTSFDRALNNAAAAGTGSSSAGGAQQQLQLQLQHQKHSSSTSPVQPLSLADALPGCSPRSGGGTAAGSGAATPTYGGRRYPGGAASSRLLSAEPSGASAAAAAAAAAVGHMGAPSGTIADAMAAIMQQQQLLRQMSSRRQQQQAGSGPDADGGTAAGQLLGQLDNRFGALKQSFHDVFGQQQQVQGEQDEQEAPNLHSQPATPLAALPPAAGAAARQPGSNAPRSSLVHGLFQGEAADPFSLGNSSSSSLGSSNDGAQGEPRQGGGSSSGARQLLQRCSEGGQEQVLTLNGGVAAGAGHSTHHGAGHDVFAALVGDYGSLLDVGASTLPLSTSTAAAAQGTGGGGPSAPALPGEPLPSGSSSDVGMPLSADASQQQRPGRQRQPRPPPPREQQQAAQGAQPGAAAGPWRPVGPVSSSAQTFSAGSEAAPPQPRALRPQPSVRQQTLTHRQRQQKGGGTRAGTAGAALGMDNSSTSTATASDAAGVVLDAAEEQRWASAALRAAKQQAAELQAQNDALVRVLERERQQHAKARQQVSGRVKLLSSVAAAHCGMVRTSRHAHCPVPACLPPVCL